MSSDCYNQDNNNNNNVTTPITPQKVIYRTGASPLLGRGHASSARSDVVDVELGRTKDGNINPHRLSLTPPASLAKPQHIMRRRTATGQIPSPTKLIGENLQRRYSSTGSITGGNNEPMNDTSENSVRSFSNNVPSFPNLYISSPNRRRPSINSSNSTGGILRASNSMGDMLNDGSGRSMRSSRDHSLSRSLSGLPRRRRTKPTTALRRLQSFTKLTGGFRCRATCDLPMRDIVTIFLIVTAALCGLVIGSIFVFVKGHKKTGGIYTPFHANIQQSPIWHQQQDYYNNINNGANSVGTNNTSSTNANNSNGWVVFYNIYTAKEPYLSGVDRLIIEEQLGQVGTSYAATNSGGNYYPLTVYYTSIGDIVETGWIKDLCTIKYNMTCIHVKHYKKADEMVTLSKLHQYCQHHNTQTVIYLHNKGSLHPTNKGQDRWRRTMTAAATSELCLHPPTKQCNACGMLFQPLPTNHFPGNMFTAKCTYINKLLKPSEYHKRRVIVDKWIDSEIAAGIMHKKGGLFPMESHYTGRKRYEAEHWLGSHPDLQPCDVSKNSPNINYWLEEDRIFTIDFQPELAPQYDIHANWIWYKYTSHNDTLTDPAARLRDYFLLRGIIYRWLVFYNRIANDTSWIWTWYPDGDLWKTAIHEFGATTAINALVQLPGTVDITLPKPGTKELVVQSATNAINALKEKWRNGDHSRITNNNIDVDVEQREDDETESYNHDNNNNNEEEEDGEDDAVDTEQEGTDNNNKNSEPRYYHYYN